MHFGFFLDSRDIDLLNIDLLDTHLDLLDTDIPSKQFVCLQDVLKTSSRLVFKTSSRHVFKTASKHVFKAASIHVFNRSSRHVFKTSWRLLQCNNFSSSKTSSQEASSKTKSCYAEDVLKKLSRHVLKMSSRRLDKKCLPGSNNRKNIFLKS